MTLAWLTLGFIVGGVFGFIGTCVFVSGKDHCRDCDLKTSWQQHLQNEIRGWNKLNE